MNKDRKNILFLILSTVSIITATYLIKINHRGERSEEGSSPQNISLHDSSYENICPVFSRERAAKLVELSLNCVDREFPNKPNYVFEGENDLIPPRLNTPAFFGCYDWHSAVHGHWSMARILNTYPDISNRERLLKSLMSHLDQKNIQSEIDFFNQKRNRLFERPYGWGWLLRLATELKKSSLPEMKELYRNIDPFANFISANFIKYLNRLSRPIREGTHQNTAFSMLHFYDYLAAI